MTQSLPATSALRVFEKEAAASDLAPESIDVAFGVDEAYAPHLAAAIASIVRYSPRSSFRFIVAHSGLRPCTQWTIEQLAPASRFIWIEVEEDDVPQFAARRHLTRATLHRLCLEKRAPADCRRVIYLDADIAVVGDIAPLVRVNLNGRPIGAVLDGFLAYSPFAKRWGLAPDGAYFNAGVLVIDLGKVREERAFSKAIAFQAEHDLDLEYDDQDALNWVFWKRWQPLSVAWNAQSAQALPGVEKQLDPARRLGDQKPRIIHYTGPDKPWHRSGYNPWSRAYWQGLALTPFLQDVVRSNQVSPLRRLRLLLQWVRWRPGGQGAPREMETLTWNAS